MVQASCDLSPAPPPARRLRLIRRGSSDHAQSCGCQAAITSVGAASAKRCFSMPTARRAGSVQQLLTCSGRSLERLRVTFRRDRHRRASVASGRSCREISFFSHGDRDRSLPRYDAFQGGRPGSPRRSARPTRRTAASISAASSGWSLRKSRELSRPWPMRWPVIGVPGAGLLHDTVP